MKRFAGIFHWAQTSYFWRVYYLLKLSQKCWRAYILYEYVYLLCILVRSTFPKKLPNVPITYFLLESPFLKTTNFFFTKKLVIWIFLRRTAKSSTVKCHSFFFSLYTFTYEIEWLTQGLTSFTFEKLCYANDFNDWIDNEHEQRDSTLKYSKRIFQKLILVAFLASQAGL